ncbi:transposase [Burkholderia sp. SRS-W-2-2016]|uniref:transposase n=1 Tax=Burkholderia sp. SRS-W-2-2016 TaxID=1926878 RepID=UPI00094AD559|nr:transposase [Burkholderia sp. SRS-W-2-2016]OLL28946.1 transposase [Burkholderia sp. SRS-W-2-2016]
MLDLPLSDDAWARVSHLFQPPPNKRFGRPARPPREILNAILWVLTRNEKWHRLPTTFPPSQTCYIKWLQWRRAGLMSAILDALELTEQLAALQAPAGAVATLATPDTAEQPAPADSDA